MTQASIVARNVIAAAALIVLGNATLALATPSTTFWAPSTAAIQPRGVFHVTYDTYFDAQSSYPVDLGGTIGILPWEVLTAEVGFDFLYPSGTTSGSVAFPVILNAKVGAAENTYFSGQPGWSLGIYGVGFETDYNDQNVCYAMLGKSIPYLGIVQAGGYYALNEDLFRTPSGDAERTGLLAGWCSPAVDVPQIDKVLFMWDLQTGQNVLGATGGGLGAYVTPAVGLLTGPVFFFEESLQPGGASWMWSVQLDVDIDLLSGGD
jgi:hypothetical protein